MAPTSREREHLLFVYTSLTLVSFYVNVRVPWRAVIARWQRAVLDLTDLNLVKEGSDLKKERAGRKSSFSSGLLTSSNLSPVDSARSAIREGMRDRAGFMSVAAIVRLLHFYGPARRRKI